MRWKRIDTVALAVGGALAAVTPWSSNPLPAGLAVGLGLAALAAARPAGRSWWLLLALVPAWVGAVLPRSADPSINHLEAQFDRRCRTMLAIAQSVTDDPSIGELVIGTGATLDPDTPFALLSRFLKGRAGLTVFLADERGGVVAWAGRRQAFPEGVRVLGDRQWSLVHSAGSVTLTLREPLFREGRLTGSVLIVETSPHRAREAFGLTGSRLKHGSFDFSPGGEYVVRSAVASSVSLPVSWRAGSSIIPGVSAILGWILLSLLAFGFRSPLTLPIAAVGAVAPSGPLSLLALSVLIYIGALGMSLLADTLDRRRSRWLVVLGIGALLFLSISGVTGLHGDWLPEHLLEPGWGVVWLAAAASLLAAWPETKWNLERRLASAFVLAALALGASLTGALLPLLKQVGPAELPEPANAEGDLDTLLAWEHQGITDLASVLAHRWNLDLLPRGFDLLVFDDESRVVSRWGDLAPAEPRINVFREWTTDRFDAATIQLRAAEEPWALLGDWPTRGGLDSVREAPVWWAVLSRSGTVAASLHGDVRALGPVRAGELYHRDGGWCWVEVGDRRLPARVQRVRSWLLARIARIPPVSAWVVRGLLAIAWVLLAMAVARPPVVMRERTATFGGRLRLLVAGAVVVPLAVLSLVLQVRISGQEREADRAIGEEAFRSVRYTAEHLGGDFQVDDAFARWLAKGWGGEVILFDGVIPVAQSRPDLFETGVMPQLPLKDVYPLFLLGRDDVVVRRLASELVAAGAVRLNRQRLLLQLFKEERVGDPLQPQAVDWLFGGAVVAALLALALAGRIERRLSQSLRVLVGVSRRLLNGEPLGAVRRPAERDLAEVVDAVETMSLSVQEREASLRDQEELLRITLRHLDPAVIVTDHRGHPLLTNPNGERILEHNPDVVQTLAAEEKDGPVFPEIIRPDPGRELSWKVGRADVPLPGGRQGKVIVVQDITDVVRADRLEQLTHMARIVAHEVKNPLTPIRLWVQELQENRKRDAAGLEELVDEAAEAILGQTRRLEETANAFSNLVALEHWEVAPVDLSALAEEAGGHLSVLRRRGGTIRLELEPAGRCVVMADARWLLRALDTVLLNSMTVIDVESGAITIRTTSTGDSRILEVEDNGGGIADGRFDDLFAPHFSAKGSGTGLGLALVRQVVMRAHGSVEAFNGEAGLVVRMHFPRPTGDGSVILASETSSDLG